MSQLFYLSAEQLERIKPFFPRSHGIPRVDDRKVVSGIIYVIKHGLQWKDAPREYGPYKTLYNRFLRWSRMGVFNNIFTELAKTAGQDGQVSDYQGALLLMDALDALPEAKALLADRGYDADWFRDALSPETLSPASRPKGAESNPARRSRSV